MKSKESKLWPVVMAGGSGSRLWPLSRSSMPKQFCTIDGNETLFFQTIKRAALISNKYPLLVIINKEYKFLAIRELERLGVEYHLILEPEKKNTAPAIALACRFALNIDDDPHLLVLSSDHYVSNQEDFNFSITNALQNQTNELIVTFGAKASSPETGYGYIHYEKSVNDVVMNIKKFVEKPSKEKASEYIKDDCYLWNTGIFLFSAKTMLDELRSLAKDIYEVSEEISCDFDLNNKIHELNQELFSKFENISIDYAVLEKTNKAKVVPITFAWSDLGTWPSIWKNAPQKDSNNNLIEGDVNIIDTTNSLILSKDKHISAIGIDNLIVIDTPDALLVSSMDGVEKINFCLENIKKIDQSLVEENRKVFRPWGWYDSIDNGESHQVKRIHVYPGQKLSLQRHQHRAERWVVIKGIATVTLDKDEYDFKVGEVVQINIMQIHSLENKTTEDLEIIEVQLGNYLGEDDIERFEDIYGRT